MLRSFFDYSAFKTLVLKGTHILRPNSTGWIINTYFFQRVLVFSYFRMDFEVENISTDVFQCDKGSADLFDLQSDE